MWRAVSLPRALKMSQEVLSLVSCPAIMTLPRRDMESCLHGSLEEIGMAGWEPAPVGTQVRRKRVGPAFQLSNA